MQNAPASATPSTWLKACWLWLLTNSIGAVGLLLTLLLFSSRSHSDSTEVSAIGEFAAVGSLVIIPLAVPTFRYLPTVDNRSYRLLAAFVAIAFFFLFPTVCLTLFVGHTFASDEYFIINERTVMLELIKYNAWLYLPAALLAAAVIYRRGLFRPTLARIELNYNE